jgi:type II secretory pathway component PulM
MNKTIGRREQVLILILVVVLLATVYYQFLYKSVEHAKVQYDTVDLQTELTKQLTIAANIQKMNAEIQANKENKTGEVSTYDNLKQEINELNDIFGDADNFSFSFDQAVATDDAVRRVITGSFTAVSYQDARDRLQKLHDGAYRCLITDLSMSPTTLEGGEGDSKNLNGGPVAVSFTVTFYETLYQASTTAGLAVEDSSSGDSESLTDQLAESKEEAENTGSGY